MTINAPDISVAQYEQRQQARVDRLACDAHRLTVPSPPPPKVKPPAKPRWSCRPVVDDTTGIIYESRRAAAKALGVSFSNVYGALRNGGLCAGHRLHRIGEVFVLNPRSRAWKRAVRDVTSGKVYSSLSEASRDTGIGVTTVHKSLVKGRPYLGRMFEYVEATCGLTRRPG